MQHIRNTDVFPCHEGKTLVARPSRDRHSCGASAPPPTRPAARASHRSRERAGDPRERVALTAKRAQWRARALEVHTVLRYVDSSGWTWEVCEVARDLDAGSGSEDAPAPDAPSLPAATPPREREMRAALPDGPADLRPIPRADRADGRGGEETDPFADDGALYFLSRLGTRKLRRYPSSWHELARTELEALCSRAELV